MGQAQGLIPIGLAQLGPGNGSECHGERAGEVRPDQQQLQRDPPYLFHLKGQSRSHSIVQVTQLLTASSQPH